MSDIHIEEELARRKTLSLTERVMLLEQQVNELLDRLAEQWPEDADKLRSMKLP